MKVGEEFERRLAEGHARRDTGTTPAPGDVIQEALEYLCDRATFEGAQDINGVPVVPVDARANAIEHHHRAALAELASLRTRLAEAESLNRKHDTETTSIHADMLALAALVGVHYEGLSSPAGFLHADIMPAVKAIGTHLGEVGLEAIRSIQRADRAEAELAKHDGHTQGLVADKRALEKRATRAECAFAKYARHLDTCAARTVSWSDDPDWNACTCGLRSFLEGADK